MSPADCVLCSTTGGTLVFQGAKFRVIRAQEVGFPAFYRVVWNAHVAEFSDLSEANRACCMAAVNGVEQALRSQLPPCKINLAALGNAVAHLHWHVIARFVWDSHFPAPVWCTAQRPIDAVAVAAVEARLGAVELAIERGLTALSPVL
ncbi:MAG: diadenosine tetraphosphate (Ap4A) HIT family hydrolase [Rhodoferax sp.]|jgi:diadenosine tetraphosphate (Ap4A) HIT family hydrolase